MKMKYGYIFILLSAFILSCEQEMSSEQADSFIKFYGSYLMDEAGDVEVLGNGGYAICGTETSETEGKRMVLIVTDAFGNVKSGFPRYFMQDGLETGGSSLIALQNGSGGFVLSGYVEKPLAGSSGVQKDIFVVRTTAAGDTSWQRSYGSLEDELVLHSIEGIRSGYMLAGYQLKGGKSDIMVMAVTEEGDSVRLSLNYNNPNAENSAATNLLKAGNMYLCACTYDKINAEGTGIQVLTFDDDLSPLARKLSGEYNEYGTCILEDGGGRFLVLGNREGASGRSEILLYAIETQGLLITSSTLNATISEVNADLRGERLTKTSSGGLAITGTRRADNNDEILLQLVSASYQVEMPVSFGASGSQTGKDIELADDGGFVVLGTNSEGESSTISLLKTNSSGLIK
jgi:hypothetical protein